METIKYLNLERLDTLPLDVLDDRVKVLHLKWNLFTTLPATISSLVNLVELNLDSNLIETLPPELSFLESLEKLHLKKNKLTVIPDSVFKLKNLKILNLFGNNIRNIGPGIRQLKNLEHLVLANNQFNEFPDDVCYCTSLSSLQLPGNEIWSIPKEIVYLANLVDLSVSYNKIKLIPFNLPLMNSLKILDLYYNSLFVMPANICTMTDVDCFTKHSFSDTMQNVDDIERLVRKQYNLRIVPFSNTCVTLKELALRAVGRSSDVIDSHSLPPELKSLLSYPAGSCQNCGQVIYAFSLYVIYSNEMMERFGCRKKMLESGRDLLSETERNILLLCSSKCFMPFCEILF